MEKLWFAVVTFGVPSIRYRKVHNSKEEAERVAREVKGSGTCSDARVAWCSSRRAAREADISDAPNSCYCGTMMPVVARNQTPFQFCSEACKAKYGGK